MTSLSRKIMAGLCRGSGWKFDIVFWFTVEPTRIHKPIVFSCFSRAFGGKKKKKELLLICRALNLLANNPPTGSLSLRLELNKSHNLLLLLKIEFLGLDMNPYPLRMKIILIINNKTHLYSAKSILKMLPGTLQ